MNFPTPPFVYHTSGTVTLKQDPGRTLVDPYIATNFPDEVLQRAMENHLRSTDGYTEGTMTETDQRAFLATRDACGTQGMTLSTFVDETKGSRGRFYILTGQNGAGRATGIFGRLPKIS